MPDAIDGLAAKGIAVAWAPDFDWRSLWIPAERMLVLNASETRESLLAEVDHWRIDIEA